MNIVINVLLGINMLVALLMVLVILMQRPKSEGLGAAFGGGVTENIFGAQTTNVLTKFTGWLAAIFFILTFVLGVLYAQRSAGGSELRRELMRTQAAATPAAAPATSPLAPAAPAASVKPEDLAVGAVPAGPAVPVAGTTPTSATTATPSPKKP